MRRNGPKEKGNAFTLLEMLVTILLIGVLTYITVPNIKFELVNQQIGETTARKLVADLRLTQQLALSHAVNNSNGFVLEMIDNAPFSGYTIENLDTGEVVQTISIDVKANCTGGDTFKFGPLGNLLSSDTQLVVSADAKTFTINIIPATGRVQLIEN